MFKQTYQSNGLFICYADDSLSPDVFQYLQSHKNVRLERKINIKTNFWSVYLIWRISKGMSCLCIKDLTIIFVIKKVIKKFFKFLGTFFKYLDISKIDTHFCIPWILFKLCCVNFPPKQVLIYPCGRCIWLIN